MEEIALVFNNLHHLLNAIRPSQAGRSPNTVHRTTQVRSLHHPRAVTAPPTCGHCTTQVRSLHHPSAVTAPPMCGHRTTQLRSLHHPNAVTAPPKCSHCTAQVLILNTPRAMTLQRGAQHAGAHPAEPGHAEASGRGFHTFASQPEPFMSPKRPIIHYRKCSRQAGMWTSVSPWPLVDFFASPEPFSH